MTDPYEAVAKIYDHMMRKINYEDWALYMYDLLLSVNKEPGMVLELGAGNCKLAECFKAYHKNFICSDISKAMLRKSRNSRLNKVCCDMRMLPFNTKFDYVFSTFDTVNYLMDFDELVRLFKNVKNILTEDGYFTFDASLEKNSINNEKGLNRRGRLKGIRYQQKSFYDKKEKIHYNKFLIKLENGSHLVERHQQKVYDFYDYFEAADIAGLFVKECFEAFSFDDADQDSERAQFLLRKI